MKVILRYGLMAAMLATLVGRAAAAENDPAPRLLPFQGRLTDQEGKAVENGAYLILFQMFDAPVNGTVKWMGELHRTSVNGGLVNVQLGSGTPFGTLDFDQPLFLQITVDINKDGMINQEDPPMLPRQAILPAVFAKESAVSRDSNKLAGRDWSSILVEGNDPEASQIRGNKIQEKSIQRSQLAPGSIGAVQLGAESVGLAHLTDDAVSIEKLTPILRKMIEEVLAPPGTVAAWMGTNSVAPEGWEFCWGQPVSRTEAKYKRLFDLIGTSNGGGNGSTTFNLPDLRGYFLRGADAPGGVNSTYAERDPDRATMRSGGGGEHLIGSVQTDEFMEHKHASGIALSHGNWSWGGNNIGVGTIDLTRYGNAYGWPAGGSETRPKNVYVQYIIKL